MPETNCPLLRNITINFSNFSLLGSTLYFSPNLLPFSHISLLSVSHFCLFREFCFLFPSPCDAARSFPSLYVSARYSVLSRCFSSSTTFLSLSFFCPLYVFHSSIQILYFGHQGRFSAPFPLSVKSLSLLQLLSLLLK